MEVQQLRSAVCCLNYSLYLFYYWKSTSYKLQSFPLEPRVMNSSSNNNPIQITIPFYILTAFCFLEIHGV